MEEIKDSEMKEKMEWRFGVAANIKKSFQDEDGVVHYGCKPFRPGTKVYVNGKDWNPTKRTHIGVIGRNRFGRIALEFIPIELLENFRAVRIYNPRVLSILHYEEWAEGYVWWDRTVDDRKESEAFAKAWSTVEN